MTDSVMPFAIDIEAPALVDLHRRLARTRWPEPLTDGWDAGSDVTYMKEFIGYWRNGYDWKAEERALNSLPQFKAAVGGVDIHFVHARGRGPRPLPLLLTHGWPDSFLRFRRIIPLLADPASHGADPDDAFDVVVPSLPGTPFSAPLPSGSPFKIHQLWASLMTDVLDYERFGAHGGDWGSVVTERLARDYAKSVVGVHLTDVPFIHTFRPPGDLTPAEQNYLDENRKWQEQEGAYAMIQGTRPQTLAAGLADSPAALAAWFLEKFQTMNDCGGDLDRCFGKDALITNVMLYWLTGSIASSFAPYHGVLDAGAPTWIGEQVRQWVGADDVPAGFALFPRDNTHPPREWAERFFRVQRWTPMPRGAHFTAMEEPELLAVELRAFFRPLRATTSVQ
jgi:pimeloyl-ACP methyl ester carboxylesterase